MKSAKYLWFSALCVTMTLNRSKGISVIRVGETVAATGSDCASALAGKGRRERGAAPINIEMMADRYYDFIGIAFWIFF
jgi:hypothetical protein